MIIRFSGPLLRHVDFRREIQVDARNLREALALLVKECPSIQPVLYDGRGQIRGVHRLFVGGEQLKVVDLEREIKPDECVDVVTSIAGG
jgi:sulfur-carrier protein